MKIKHIRGSTKQNNFYTGPDRTLSVDLDTGAVRVHDGKTPGGYLPFGVKSLPSEKSGFVYGIKNGKFVAIDVERIREPTGPGPDELIHGDFNRGFYGEVSAAELINGPDLALEIGLSMGDDMNLNEPWLKFSLDGKTLFVAKKTLKSNITWDAIYQAGAVYASDDFGRHPRGTNRLQNAKVSVAGYRFKVRLLRGSSVDPLSISTYSSTLPELPELLDSEWNQLIVPLANGEWENYSLQDLGILGSSGIGSQTWCQEAGANGNYRLIRGTSSATDYRLHNPGRESNTRYRGWRPVLELIN